MVTGNTALIGVLIVSTTACNGTASRRYMGALPAAGQWVRLEVAASQLGLEGSVLRGASFSLFGGRATFDAMGKATAGSGTVTNPPITTPTNTPPVVVTNRPPVVTTNVTSSTNITGTLWVDDSLPAGAISGTSGGDVWNWVSTSPAPLLDKSRISRLSLLVCTSTISTGLQTR